MNKKKVVHYRNVQTQRRSSVYHVQHIYARQVRLVCSDNTVVLLRFG